jgi:hypothetical protein
VRRELKRWPELPSPSRSMRARRGRSRATRAGGFAWSCWRSRRTRFRDDRARCACRSGEGKRERQVVELPISHALATRLRRPWNRAAAQGSQRDARGDRPLARRARCARLSVERPRAGPAQCAGGANPAWLARLGSAMRP